MTKAHATTSSLEPSPESATGEWSIEPESKESHGLCPGRIVRSESGVPCPECGSSMTPECGCWLCHHCGFSCCG